MAHIELETEDLNCLIEFLKTHKSYSELSKLKNFQFTEDGKLIFEQSFSFVTTTVQLSLSRDVSGQFLLIDIICLAENYLGNKVLWKFIPLIAEIVEQKTNGVLTKYSDRQMSLDLSRILPVPIVLKNCNVSDKCLCIDIAIGKN